MGSSAQEREIYEFVIYLCSLDIDECTNSPNICANPDCHCENTIGTYMCECEGELAWKHSKELYFRVDDKLLIFTPGENKVICALLHLSTSSILVHAIRQAYQSVGSHISETRQCCTTMLIATIYCECPEYVVFFFLIFITRTLGETTTGSFPRSPTTMSHTTTSQNMAPTLSPLATISNGQPSTMLMTSPTENVSSSPQNTAKNILPNTQRQTSSNSTTNIIITTAVGCTAVLVLITVLLLLVMRMRKQKQLNTAAAQRRQTGQEARTLQPATPDVVHYTNIVGEVAASPSEEHGYTCIPDTTARAGSNHLGARPSEHHYACTSPSLDCRPERVQLRSQSPAQTAYPEPRTSGLLPAHSTPSRVESLIRQPEPLEITCNATVQGKDTYALSVKSKSRGTADVPTAHYTAHSQITPCSATEGSVRVTGHRAAMPDGEEVHNLANQGTEYAVPVKPIVNPTEPNPTTELIYTQLVFPPGQRGDGCDIHPPADSSVIYSTVDSTLAGAD